MINFEGKLKLSDIAVIREEHFGGLLFSKKDKSIMELNHTSYILLSFLDGKQSLNSILKKSEFLGITKDQVTSFINQLIDKGLVYNV